MVCVIKGEIHRNAVKDTVKLKMNFEQYVCCFAFFFFCKTLSFFKIYAIWLDFFLFFYLMQ